MRALLDAVMAIELPLAHDIALPHEEPQRSGGGASTVVIAAVIVATLAVAGALIWLRERTRRADQQAPPAAD